MNSKSKQRTALITGSTRGLGLAIAMHLAKSGFQVALNYANNRNDGLRALEAVQAVGTAALFKADVCSERGVRKLVDKVTAELGPIDVLVINASPSQPYKKLTRHKEKDFRVMLDAFCLSAHYLTDAVVESMQTRRYGRIIHINSEVLYDSGPNFCAYTAAKGAQLGYARSSAIELAPFGITINSVAPGWIPVERHSEVPTEDFENYRKTIPVGRLGTPEDIAAAVAYFASEHAGFVTGQSLIVNGGRYLQ